MVFESIELWYECAHLILFTCIVNVSDVKEQHHIAFCSVEDCDHLVPVIKAERVTRRIVRRRVDKKNYLILNSCEFAQLFFKVFRIKGAVFVEEPEGLEFAPL